MPTMGAMLPITVAVVGSGAGLESESWAGRFVAGFGSEERLPVPVMEICYEHQCVCRSCGRGFKC